MLSALPKELLLRREAQQLPPLPPQITEQLANTRYWHIYSKQYVRNDWSIVSRVVERTPIEELQISDNEYPGILKEIAHIQLPNLLSLSLISNNIVSIEAFIFLQAPLLEKVHLSRNCIRIISPLRKANLPRLQLLALNDNPIIDCESINQCHFPRLEFLLLENWDESNPIGHDINYLFKLEARNLSFLGIRSNQRIKQPPSVSFFPLRYRKLQINGNNEE